MKKSYYLFNPGRLSRKDNTLKFVPVQPTEENDEKLGSEIPAEINEDDSEQLSQSDDYIGEVESHSEVKKPQVRYLPIEAVDELYVFGSLDANSAMYNFLGKNQIAVHFFDYYDNYTGSFMPKDYLLAGKTQVEQVKAYLSHGPRLQIAKEILMGATFNIVKNLKYYLNREKDLEAQINSIEDLRQKFDSCKSIPEFMAIEGNIRQVYYSGVDEIIQPYQMNGRSKNPPGNEVNALISFGNMLCYSKCLSQIYHTQLNPTISFLHEPGARRYSLALDLAELFKPVLVDRLIFRMLNKNEIQKDDFDSKVGGFYLKENARKKFVQAFDERLQETIQHRSLGRKVSYLRLIRLECYKLMRHILGIDQYKSFKTRW